MRALIVYDTQHGNTEQVAQAVAAGLTGLDVSLKKAEDATPEDLQDLDLLIVGCPVHAWSPSQAAKAFLKRLQGATFSGTRAAAFDTKFKKFYAGGAAKKVARNLSRLGFAVIAQPESFNVTGMEGPLQDGELERARNWAASLPGN